MTEYSDQFEFEVAVIGDAVEYLEKHRDSIVDSYSIPNTGEIEDQEGRQWIKEVQELIDHLLFGTVGGRAFNNQREYRKNEIAVAEAWEQFREDNPKYFGEVS